MIIKSHQFVPNQDSHMNPDTRHSDIDIPGRELFGGYFQSWLGEQNRDLDSLVSLVNAKPDDSRTDLSQWTRSVSQLVHRVMCHYEGYYRVKADSVRRDAVHMMTPAWRSHLEDTFLWIGGWRPSMAFHLLYSLSGLQLEAGLSELLSGLSTGDLADLSPSQLDRVDELQRVTIKEEKALTESFAAHQETVADSSMVELTHLATELTRDPDSVTRDPDSVGERVESELAGKEVKLQEILLQADELRLKTLKKIVDILSPVQAAHFLIGAAELHLRVHEWGEKKDGHFNGVVRPNGRPNGQ